MMLVAIKRELLTNFVAEFPRIRKAVYIFTEFWGRQSYMMAALAHDLSEKRSVSATLLHYPSFLFGC